MLVLGSILLLFLTDEDLPTSTSTATENATVVSVTDGDTIRVDYAGGSDQPVRLIGINAPELDECLGAEATDALAQLVEGKEVTLVGDIAYMDDFSRLLRYTYLPDGTFVNEILVRRGLALANEFPPNVKQSETLAAAQTRAQDERLGVWADDACGAPVEATLVITHVEYDAPGNDNNNLTGEWVDIKNVGFRAIDLSGWVLKDESSSHRYTFREGFALDSNAQVRVFTGCGTDTVGPSSAELHWCEDGAVWNNAGDTAFLLDPDGNIHDNWSY